MRQRYDASSKWLIEKHGNAILQLAGVTGISSWRALPGEVVQSRQLPDGLIEAKLDGCDESALFLVEINTYPDQRKVPELLDDMLLTWLNRRRLPEIVTLVLCPKGQASISRSVDMTSPLGWSGLRAYWRVVNLWEVPVENLMPIVDVGLVPWIPLTRIDGPPEPVLQMCRDAIDGSSASDADRMNLLAVTQILGNLRYDVNLMKALFSRSGTMIESPILTEWLMEQDIKTRQAVILELIEARFRSVPADVSAAIRVVQDFDRLRQLTTDAYTSNSLDAFRSALSTN